MNWIMNIIGYPLGWVMWAAFKVIPVYSIALIIFTIIVRAAMLPLSIKQQKNTAHGALFRPKIDEINKKYANNREKAQEEINKLYEREGYNPFGGCSSLFIQLPILYGFIDVVYRPMTHILRLPKDVIATVQSVLEKAGVDFSTNRAMDIEMQMMGYVDKYKDALIDGVGADTYEKIASLDMSLFGVINLGEMPTWGLNWLILIPLFSLITALASSFISMKMTGQSMDGQGKGCNYAMVFLMPFMSAYFSFIVPAGVGLYWIISNIVSCAQSVVLKRLITPEKVAEQLARDKAKGKKQKKSKMMQRLVEAQKQQAEMQQGALSEQERRQLENKQKAIENASKTKGMSEKERIAEARRRYAEKYGDDVE